jgi:prevent-host-death family protein
MVLVEVSIYEAKNHLSDLIRRAERGEEVILNRHGRPVARIVGLAPAKRKLGLFRGKVKETDPAWWRPMTEEEAEAFYRGEY